MAARCLQRPVLVYMTTKAGLLGSELVKSSAYGIDDYPGVPPVCLLFNNSHYDTLLAKA